MIAPLYWRWYAMWNFCSQNHHCPVLPKFPISPFEKNVSLQPCHQWQSWNEKVSPTPNNKTQLPAYWWSEGNNMKSRWRCIIGSLRQRLWPVRILSFSNFGFICKQCRHLDNLSFTICRHFSNSLLDDTMIYINQFGSMARWSCFSPTQIDCVDKCPMGWVETLWNYKNQISLEDAFCCLSVMKQRYWHYAILASKVSM